VIDEAVFPSGLPGAVIKIEAVDELLTLITLLLRLAPVLDSGVLVVTVLDDDCVGVDVGGVM